MVQAPSRRDRVRAATIEEIKGTARQLLVDEGPDAVSLRAIGRAMGMTAPALYRYFGNREDLLQHVCGDIFTEIAADIHAEIGRAAQASGGDMTAKLIAACRAFRSWALAHRPEFGLLFGTPLPGLEALHDKAENDVVAECADKFSFEFLALFFELWLSHPFPVPADKDSLYGMVSLEVFDHLHFALDDPAALFEYTLTELAELVGLEYPAARGPAPGGERSAPPAGSPLR